MVATHFTNLTRLLARPTTSLLCYLIQWRTEPLGLPPVGPLLRDEKSWCLIRARTGPVLELRWASVR